MTIKEAAKRTGLTEKTIRYYEEQNLIQPSKKEINGRHFREYGEQDVRELTMIATLRKLRFTVEEIRQMKLQPSGIHVICDEYQRRIEREQKELQDIREILANINISEKGSIDEISSSAEKYMSEVTLPREDREPDFSRMDKIEKKQRSIYSIKLWPKKKLFPTRLDIIETMILFYLIEKEHTFTEVCHYCISHGILSDTNVIRKVIKKMKRKKVISEKNGVCRALVSEQDISSQNIDVERMVQVVSTGSYDMLFVYNWMPPGGVSSMPNTSVGL